jgi:quercetin dioxygenase-like cupin family protein
MAERFEDERGVIQDLLGRVDAVTEIVTHPGCVRGNHVHKFTQQWVYVASGTMWTNEDGKETLRRPGDFFQERAQVPHAWKAERECTVLVFAIGPRAGPDFEDDTWRLPPEQHLYQVVCDACHKPASPGHPLSVVTGHRRYHKVCPQP